MAHSAAISILRLIPNPTVSNTRSLLLGQNDLRAISAALNLDALNIYYSALISFSDALRGLEAGYYSWSLIKLYYVCFYAARVVLAMNSVALFYSPPGNNGTPFSLLINSGEKPLRENGVTHKVVWRVMERQLPNSPLIGSIGSLKAHEWMKDLREQVNYKDTRFTEPLFPTQLSELTHKKVQDLLDIYLTDTDLLYAFDPKHAAMAYPIECLKRAAFALKQADVFLEPEDREFVVSLFGTFNLQNDLAKLLIPMPEEDK